MKVKEFMTSPVEGVRSDGTIAQAAKLMQTSDIGVLPVMDNDQVVGVLTDRDIAVRVVAEGLDPQSTPVRKAMTEQVVCCSEDDDFREAASVMEDSKVHRLLVLSEDKKVTGILAIADIVRNIRDAGLVQEVLGKICEPSRV